MNGILPITSAARTPVPDGLAAWACEIAEINADVSEEGLLVKGGYMHDGLGPISLYGGWAPVRAHIDITPDELRGQAPHPVWGFILACPEGHLHWDGGSSPIGIGSAYVVDPSILHGVCCAPGAIAFLATWGYDPVPVFGDLDRFAQTCLTLAQSMRDQTPDATAFVERELGMEGELC